jgi:ParB family chromosome partitioning protein
MEHTMIEVNKLSKSPLNVRRTVAEGTDDDLKASIASHRGIFHNLVVTAAGDGAYRVIDGARRLDAIKALQAEGKLPAEYAVPCQIRSEENALETSLAANTVRLPMNAADEFEAFARLAKDMTPEEIGQRFGKTRKYVEQRLKLGNLHPDLLNEYRAENLTLDCLMAFTMTDDREKQLQVYEAMEEWHSARNIREMLTGEMAEAKSKLARFVGLDAYHADGGVSRADLFGDQVYLENPDLLNRLAAEKLEGVRQELEAEGWKWVDINPDCDWNAIYGCGRIHPQPVNVPQELLDLKTQIEAELEDIAEAADRGGDEEELLDRQQEAEAKLAELEEKLESHVAYDPEQMAIAGCCVSIGHNGELAVEKGLVRREDMKHLAGDGETRQPKPKGMPETLCRDLEAYRLQAAQAEIARHRLVALDLLAFKIARSTVAMRPVCGGPDVHFTRHGVTPAVQKEQTVAGEALKTLAESLPMAWLHQETEAEQFQAFLSLSDKEKLDFLAYGVAASLQPQLATGNEATAYELALSLTDASVAAYWRPTRANYLGRITRDQLLGLGRDILGEPWSQARSRDKKGELADALERAFAEPEKYARNPEQLDKLKHWLPRGMAFGADTAGCPQAGAETASAAA